MTFPVRTRACHIDSMEFQFNCIRRQSSGIQSTSVHKFEVHLEPIVVEAQAGGLAANAGDVP